MKITASVTKAAIASGMGFYELFYGAEQFAAVRNGESVAITCTDGEVTGTVSSVQVGPMGQFLGQGQPHLSNAGRVQDVRNVIDSLEERFPAKSFAKPLDPRTLYTAVYVSVPYAAPVMPAVPIAA